MRYNPKYCCQCGEKIENTETLPWKSSGRFCAVCQKDFPFQEWMPTVLMFAFALFGIFGLGAYIRTPETAEPLALKQNRIPAFDNSARKESATNASQNSSQSAVLKSELAVESNLAKNANKNLTVKANTAIVAAETEKVYFCGAATKKGTACSRKVKGGGRCWQHVGQEAVLPREKLMISQ